MLWVGSMAIAERAAAQAALADSVPATRLYPGLSIEFGRLPMLGGSLDDRFRIRQIVGEERAEGYLLRSASTLLHSHATDATADLEIFLPEVRTVFNSTLPFSLNEGNLWAGRGMNLEVTAGALARIGPVTLLIAPQFAAAQNRDFQTLPYPDSQEPARSHFAAPWYYPPESLDRPQRFGDSARRTISLGQSSLTVTTGPLAAGLATENLWWGPARLNALVMSDNAPGIPHLFLRTARPVPTRIGFIEGRWIFGRLSTSDYFDVEKGPTRSVSALSVVLQPDAHLFLGFARAVYASVEGPRGWAGRTFDVFRDIGRPAARAEAGLAGVQADQIFSLFGRWIFPESGFEVYGEWGRTERPASLRDLLVAPHHTQGYTIGLQWANEVRPDLLLRLHAEATNLELSSTYRSRPTLSWYTSPAVTQGYTHHGRVIGAAIGPGASSQWLGLDLIRPRWGVGTHAGRIRWDNGVFYSRAYLATYLGHDVSVHGGIRGHIALGPVAIEAEATTSSRYNYLFQHDPITADDIPSVDIRNRTIRLGVSRVTAF